MSDNEIREILIARRRKEIREETARETKKIILEGIALTIGFIPALYFLASIPV